MNKKNIWIVSPCYNESFNVVELYTRLKKICKTHTNYNFVILFIDNASTDDTLDILKSLSGSDRSLKIIVNNRNFGHIRSPYYGIMQSKGDATVYLASDLQDPPEIISQLIVEWEAGHKIVLACKPNVDNVNILNYLRKIYYKFLDKISDVNITKDATGFGIYDRKVLDLVRTINDPYPYLRGLICELGFDIKTIEFTQPNRLRGKSKNNFYTLYDIGILGIISHSLVPIRIAIFTGFIIGALSIFLAFVFFVAKLIWWDYIPLGVAPLIIAIFGMFGLLLFFLGLIGEYIGSIHTYLQNRPVVVEKERINF